MKSIIERARRLATRAHKGQYRKWGGEDYITHPESVAKAVRGREAIVVAWLHDVVEDTDVTIHQLRLEFSDRIVDAVQCLTKEDGENYWHYIERVKTNELAVMVKLADLKHNMSTIPDGHGLLVRWTKATNILKGES